MKHKIIFCLDMDQFFAAVEIRHNPALRGKPVIVGGTPQRGIVTTCSYEARKYGVRSGMSTAEAYRLCPQAEFIRPEFAKYLHVSKAIFRLLLDFTDRVQPMSVDEAFLDVTDAVWKDGVEGLARKIKRRIVETQGVTATIGAGATRIVAKVASGMNKPDGFTYLPPDRVADAFRFLPVGDLCGVGRATGKILEQFGVRTAGDLAAFPRDVLRRRFGKWGDELAKIARGEGDDVVKMPAEREQEKSMGHEHTFPNDLTEAEKILARLHLLSERVARRLRTARLAGRAVSIRIRYKGFETVLHGHKLKSYVQHETDIYPVAEKLFHESYRVGEPVRLVGVHVSELKAVSQMFQQELFVAVTDSTDLLRACDEIRDRFGEQSVGFASGIFSSSGRYASRSRAQVEYSPFHFDPTK